MFSRRDADDRAHDVRQPLARVRLTAPITIASRRAHPTTRPASAARYQDVSRPRTLPRPLREPCRGRAAGVADPEQLAGQVAGILPALVGILREAAGHDVIERRGGVSGCSSVTGRGSSLRIEEIRLAWVFPLNALDPVTIS